MGHCKVKKVRIEEIKAGDTVLIDGKMETVSKHHINKSDLFGHQYKGYCYRESNGMLDVVLFPKWFKGEIVGYWSQINS